jgi:ATP-binding cassette subfamily B protein
MSYQAFNQGLALARSVLGNVGKLYENSLFLGNLFAFFSLKPHLADPTCPSPIPLIKKGIQFENVTFRYPGTNRVALQGFGLTLKSGQMAAIVGPNGAGKSTIIKLLCRLYEPERGTILIDGSPLHRFSVEQLHGRISVLFQDPIRFNSTAAENIWFGDLACRDDEWVRQVAAISGADEIIATWIPNRSGKAILGGYRTQHWGMAAHCNGLGPFFVVP